MRGSVTLAAGLAFGALLVTGCQSEAEQRAALLEQGIATCVREFGRQERLPEGMDAQSVCRCALDRMTEGKSIGEVRRIVPQDRPSAADLEAMGACVVADARRRGALQ